MLTVSLLLAVQVYASYLEVYNEVGHDLLDGSFSAADSAGGNNGGWWV